MFIYSYQDFWNHNKSLHGLLKSKHKWSGFLVRFPHHMQKLREPKSTGGSPQKNQNWKCPPLGNHMSVHFSEEFNGN